MTATPHLHALAMRTAAATVAHDKNACCPDCAEQAASAILALPLKADRTALLAEAVKVLRDDIAAQHKRVMSGEQRFYAKNITNACSEMGGPLGNAVERLIAALSALETP